MFLRVKYSVHSAVVLIFTLPPSPSTGYGIFGSGVEVQVPLVFLPFHPQAKEAGGRAGAYYG